jgi:conjugative transfer region lipoprotein (TIGR03751 family)
MPVIRIVAIIWTSLLLAVALQGCASTKEEVFPAEMRSMREVYDDHFAQLRTHGIEGARVELHGERLPSPAQAAEPSEAGNTGSHLPSAFIEGVEPQLAGYTREAHTEIEALFPTLPNPQLVMYVYPHLGEDGAPVPGYATAFPLYEHVEYALPGEIP